MIHISSLEAPHLMKVFISRVIMVDGQHGVLIIGLPIMPNFTADCLVFQMMVSKRGEIEGGMRGYNEGNWAKEILRLSYRLL